MTEYFPQKNWDPFVYQRLNELINQNKQDLTLAKEWHNYVVFDFDNTSIIGDVEDNMMMYMAEHLLYKIKPDEFKEILTSSPFDLNYTINKANPGMTPMNMALDIIDEYEWLWTHYINAQNPSSLDEIKRSVHYQSFRAKLRYFYLWVNKLYTRLPGQPWLTYWFSGYTSDELIQLVKEMVAWARQQKPERRLYKSSIKALGRSGYIESHFTSGLAFPPELIDLYQAFQANGMTVYVVSASPIDVVRTAASEFDFNLPADRVIGMYYTHDQEGRIQSHMSEDAFITKREGKTQAIQEQIMPKQGGRQPLALFGDSMGDYDMMRQLEDVQLNVLFNCLNPDQTRELVQEAKEMYGKADASIVVQGRDENTLQLIPSPKSIALGEKEPKLFIQ